jgi:hypothetical protein
VRVTAFYQDITRVKSDIFVAGFTAEVRPPRGLMGKVDWYLGGFLSRQILEASLHGGPGEMTLVALKGKLLTTKLLLLGLGGGADLRKEDVSGQFRRIGQAVRDLKLTSVALEIPLIETPRSGTYEILQETLAGFRQAYRENDIPVHCEVQILSRTEAESEGWRKVIRGLPR